MPFGLGYLIDGTLAGAADRGAVGRPGADLRAAPRDLVDQLGLPLLRDAPLRGRGPLDQRLLARSLLSFGESWHHNHHAFPRSAVHGLRWWEIDPTAWLIRGMRRLRLAWNVVEITPERQREKLAV